MYTNFKDFFTVTTRSLWHIKVRLSLPPHFYFETHSTANIDVTCLIYWCIMAHKQSYVTVILNKRRYSSNIAMFDMSTIILHNTLKTTTPLDEATISYVLWYLSPLDDYCNNQSTRIRMTYVSCYDASRNESMGPESTRQTLTEYLVWSWSSPFQDAEASCGHCGSCSESLWWIPRGWFPWSRCTSQNSSLLIEPATSHCPRPSIPENYRGQTCAGPAALPMKSVTSHLFKE